MRNWENIFDFAGIFDPSQILELEIDKIEKIEFPEVFPNLRSFRLVLCAEFNT